MDNHFFMMMEFEERGNLPLKIRFFGLPVPAGFSQITDNESGHTSIPKKMLAFFIY